MTGILCVLLFGCRHSEAAYMISANSFTTNKFDEFPDAVWAVTVPPTYNKTKILYKWPVPAEMEWMVESVRALHEREPTLRTCLGDAKTTFSKALEYWYVSRVIPDAAQEYDEVTERTEPEGGEIYSMRTIRSFHAAEWAKAYYRAKRLNEPLPFNPLQHTDIRTTLQHYVPADGEVLPTTASERREAKRRSKQEESSKNMSPKAGRAKIVSVPIRSARKKG